MNTNMNAAEADADAPAELTCSHCQRLLDWCAFCDETRCAVAVCYRCMIVALGETAPQPHTHGG